MRLALQHALQVSFQRTLLWHLPGDQTLDIKPRSLHRSRTASSVSQHHCQVVALRLRSATRAGNPAPDPRDELDYPALLNRALPGDIRVLGWAPVPAGFSARFSTLHRTYRHASRARPHSTAMRRDRHAISRCRCVAAKRDQ